MSASNEMEALLKRIYLPTVFYFPYELFPNLSQETKKNLEAYHFFEDLGILKIDGKVSSINEAANSLELYKKDVILESNLFQLLEMKERLKSQSFGFLLEKYLANVNAWIYAYNWLSLNLVKQIPQASKSHIPLFEYQKVILENHLTTLKQYFKFKANDNPTTDEMVNVLLDNNETLSLDKALINDIVEASKDIKNIEKQKPIKKAKKQLLLTAKQADDYLLKTVFRIKTD
jgi:hypothetical protein